MQTGSSGSVLCVQRGGNTPPCLFFGGAPHTPTSPSIGAPLSLELGECPTVCWSGTRRLFCSSGATPKEESRCGEKSLAGQRVGGSRDLQPALPPAADPSKSVSVFVRLKNIWLIFGTLKACKSELPPQVLPQAPGRVCEMRVCGGGGTRQQHTKTPRNDCFGGALKTEGEGNIQVNSGSGIWCRERRWSGNSPKSQRCLSTFVAHQNCFLASPVIVVTGGSHQRPTRWVTPETKPREVSVKEIRERRGRGLSFSPSKAHGGQRLAWKTAIGPGRNQAKV